MKYGKITVLAPAKINLYLAIRGIRPDNYHEIETVMQTVTLFDKLTIKTFESESGEITTECPGCRIPSGCENIACKAARAFIEHTGIKNLGVEITIDKNIPSEAGLGGGSADAAAVITTLNSLCDTKLGLDVLFGIGASVGADVVFCLKKGTATATGYGEIIESCTPMPDCHIVIAMPEGERITTSEAYKLIGDSDRGSTLERMKNALGECDLDIIAPEMRNDFEKVIFGSSSVPRIKQKLLEYGASAALMSGSGAAVFGLFKSIEKAKAAREALDGVAETYLCAPARRDYAYIISEE